MTDRNVGGLDARVDIKPAGQPQIAGVEANLDILSQTRESRIGGEALTLDYTWPTGVQYGELVATVEHTFNPTRRLGNVLVMLDYVPTLGPPVGTVRWSASSHAFQIVGSDPAVMWSTADTFVTSGSFPIVIWNDVDNRFEQAP